MDLSFLFTYGDVYVAIVAGGHVFRAFNWVPREIDYHLRIQLSTEEIPSTFELLDFDPKRIELSSFSFEEIAREIGEQFFVMQRERRTLVTFAHLHHVTAARHPYINTESTKHLQFGSFCNAPQSV